jgi:hypothetical protein
MENDCFIGFVSPSKSRSLGLRGQRSNCDSPRRWSRSPETAFRMVPRLLGMTVVAGASPAKPKSLQPTRLPLQKASRFHRIPSSSAKTIRPPFAKHARMQRVDSYSAVHRRNSRVSFASSRISNFGWRQVRDADAVLGADAALESASA